MENVKEISELKHFQIKGNGWNTDKKVCSIFANGRHQIQITVVIEAVDNNGHNISLTPAQMKRVQLIRYDNGQPLDSSFGISYEWKGYQYSPTPPTKKEEAVNADRNTLEIYVTLSKASFEALHIAAKIELDGTPYNTRNEKVEPGGIVKEGTSNSSIMIHAQAPYIWKADKFQIKYLGTIGADAGTNPRTYFHKWEITFKDSNAKILGSNIANPVSGVYIPWFGQFAGKDNQYAHYALPIRPVGSGFWGAYLKNGGNHSRNWFVLPYTRQYAAYAMMQQENLSGDDRYVSIWVTYIDHYGCGHKVLLETYSNGSQFRISDQVGGFETDAGGIVDPGGEEAEPVFYTLPPDMAIND